jgi:hypothetical protein
VANPNFPGLRVPGAAAAGETGPDLGEDTWEAGPDALKLSLPGVGVLT